MRYDVVVVGGGTAGCVLASRLSENPDRSVCLLEAGPDYGPLADGRWPAEIVSGVRMPWTHDWGPGGEDDNSLGARILGGCSAHNACMVVRGSPADYDEWGGEWAYDRFAPFLDRARAQLRTRRQITDDPGAFYEAVVEAATAAGYPTLDDADDPSEPVGVTPCPVNMVERTRWNAAFAYLDPARDRKNLSVVDRTLVDRVILDGVRAVGVLTSDGTRYDAEIVVLAAGAYFSPAILCRSGIGPEGELARYGIPVAAALPVGERLLDHCGSSVRWEPSPELERQLEEYERDHDIYEFQLVLKGASSRCAPGTWDLHVLPYAVRDPESEGWDVGGIFFHMKPLSAGRVRLRSTDPADLPIVERGFLTHDEDVETLLEALDLVRSLAATDPLAKLLGAERRPGAADLEQYLRETTSGYYHPAGTCPLGSVVDTHARVFGIDGLYVADASFMPTIPRANTNLTTAAIAERIAADFA
ncbi:MAG TPA: GMC family oxidoreductase [Gaiellaceae bacterium]|nr:GMC family oxidoreductase [Gaiellaceae bacterium]